MYMDRAQPSSHPVSFLVAAVYHDARLSGSCMSVILVCLKWSSMPLLGACAVYVRWPGPF